MKISLAKLEHLFPITAGLWKTFLPNPKEEDRQTTVAKTAILAMCIFHSYYWIPIILDLVLLPIRAALIPLKPIIDIFAFDPFQALYT